MEAVLWEHAAEDRSAISAAMNSMLPEVRKGGKDRTKVAVELALLEMAFSWAGRNFRNGG